MQVSEIVELLDNSQDAETIALEIVSHETLQNILDLVRLHLSDEDTAILIRELWDIAYSHGYYDGRIEESEDVI